MSDESDYPPVHYLVKLHHNEKLRNFLHQLYLVPSRNTREKVEDLLDGATSEQLNFAIWTVYYVMIGRIYVKQDPHGRRIDKSRRKKFLNENFSDELNVKELIRGERSEKVKVLSHINCYEALFWMLFNPRK